MTFLAQLMDRTAAAHFCPAQDSSQPLVTVVPSLSLPKTAQARCNVVAWEVSHTCGFCKVGDESLGVCQTSALSAVWGHWGCCCQGHLSLSLGRFCLPRATTTMPLTSLRCAGLPPPAGAEQEILDCLARRQSGKHRPAGWLRASGA